MSGESVPDCDLLGALFEGDSNAGIDNILKDLSKYLRANVSFNFFFNNQ